MDPITRRFWVVVAFVIAIALLVISVSLFLSAMLSSNSTLFVAAWVMGFPSMLVFVMCMLNLSAFPRHYGWFGLKTRTPMPKNWPKEPTGTAVIRVGDSFSSWPSPVWIQPEGVGTVIRFFGAVFIPTGHFREVARVGRRIWVYHASCEIRSPVVIVFPIWTSRDAMQGIEDRVRSTPSPKAM